MKTLKLNIAERLSALGIFNNPENKVAVSDLKIYLDDVSKFRLNEEDMKKANWEEILDEHGKAVSFKWDDTKLDLKEIIIDPFTEKFLKERLVKLEFSASNPLALASLSLQEKLR